MTILNTFRRWVKEQEAVNQLNALSPRELRDIGIEADVSGYVRHANNRK